MYGGSCTMNQKLKWTLLFSFCNDAYKEYTELLYIALIARHGPQIVRYDRRNVRYDHMPCPLRSLARFFRWREIYAVGDRCWHWHIMLTITLYLSTCFNDNH